MPIGPRSSPAATARAATFVGAGQGGSDRLSSSAGCAAAVLVEPDVVDWAGLVLQPATTAATLKLRRRAATVRAGRELVVEVMASSFGEAGA